MDNLRHIEVPGDFLTRSLFHRGCDTERRQLTSKRRHCAETKYSLFTVLTFLVLISCCCSPTSAYATRKSHHLKFTITEELVDPPDIDLARSAVEHPGGIVVDQRPAPRISKAWTLATEDDLDLRKRGSLESEKESSSTRASSTTSHARTATTSAASHTKTLAATTTTSGSSVAGTTAASPLPSAFDSGLGTNFSSQTCQNFMTSFLANSTFKECLPVSLMLQNSEAFFQAEKSITTITEVLDQSCAVNSTQCGSLMSSIANNLTSASNCLTDYQNQNPVVMAAYYGLKSYMVTYEATCLIDNTTSAYCFGEAITNAESPTDSYIYYLPLNNSLPGGSQPTCNSCLMDTMDIYQTASADRDSAIASTYVSAAQQVNINCGPTFVNTTEASVATTSDSTRAYIQSPGLGTFALVAIIAALLS